MSASKLPAISVPALPSEIIEAILTLLPAKSLGRFKSVSKTWNSLISDPKFIKKNLQHHPQTPTKLILLSDTDSLQYSLDTNQFLPYLNINNNDDDDDIPATAVKEVSFRFKEIFGSCNGLVLAKDENDTIFMINPATQDRFEVPLPPFVLPDDIDLIVWYGFGYDSSTDDYKVVSLTIWYLRREYEPYSMDTYVSLYSLRNNSWNKLSNSSHFFGLHADSPVVINQSSYQWFNDFSTISAFSFTTEEFSEFRLQFLDLFKNRLVQFYDLVDIGGKLGVFLRVGGGGFEMWVMEDVGTNTWTRVCFHEFKDLRDRLKPVCLVEGSYRDIILDVKGDVLVFNIDDGRSRNVRIEGGPAGGFTVLGTYAESLESPKRILTPP
ncbi:hypothetical protein SSX86_001397 [Deinandra increscens subsp. villosa]|uniref:F-box domain-containing protein n=1 Tax=Deinandra increscens subsp. villosa TaxID=3103831 RepID=A0AAP0HAS2_9ASTR